MPLKLICVGLLIFATIAQAKQIAFTFDDAPNSATALSGPQRAFHLIESLREAGISQAAFFVNSEKMDAEGLSRLKFYARSGHLIANHTHSHPDFNVSYCEDYLQDIRTADEYLRNVPGFIRWFRFPFLREGETEAKRDRARAELERLGYFNAYVTVNIYDWYLDSVYQRARQAQFPIDYEALKKTYVQVLVASVQFYDKMAIESRGRSPKQVMLLHENDLAAFFISDVVKELRRLGWQIISAEDAYTDEIAEFKTSDIFRANPGRIGEIAQAKNWNGPLWCEACDERYLDSIFIRNKVFAQ